MNQNAPFTCPWRPSNCGAEVFTLALGHGCDGLGDQVLEGVRLLRLLPEVFLQASPEMLLHQLHILGFAQQTSQAPSDLKVNLSAL